MMSTILQQIILGAAQGITEWIPISSTAVIYFIIENFFGNLDAASLIRVALFFHLGTFFAALIYFRKEVGVQFKTLFNFKKAEEKNKQILKFLIITTLISGILGYILLKVFESIQEQITPTGQAVTAVVGFLLLFTGAIQLKTKKIGLKKEESLKTSDSILLGIAQGISVLPGISRSGITVSALMLKKYDDTSALRLSFMMSLPIVLAGNIILNLGDFSFSSGALFGVLASFILGIATIHVLMKASKKINFGWFAIAFAVLMFASIFI